jgi:DNA-binding MarR family transcriptional regulator
MTRSGKATGRESHQQKLARRFLEVLEAIIERNMRLPQEHVSAMLALSPPEMRSLMWLSRRGKSVMSDYAQGIGVPLSTATRIVNRLVKKGIVVRRRSDEDRRIVEIDLSAEAYEHRTKFVARRQAALASMLEPLAREERETVLNLLEKGLRLSAADGAELKK